MSELKEYLSLDSTNRNLYGCGYYEISTGLADRAFIDDIIFHNHHISQIVELGTFKGVTSLHLGMSARVMEKDFYTFDIEDLRPLKIKKAWLDNMHFYQEDILSLNQNLVNIISKPNTLIFIDNGDKEKEFNMYVPFLGPNSIIIIHDWETEVFLKNIQETIDEFLLEPYNEKLGDMLGTHCKAWRTI